VLVSRNFINRKKVSFFSSCFFWSIKIRPEKLEYGVNTTSKTDYNRLPELDIDNNDKLFFAPQSTLAKHELRPRTFVYKRSGVPYLAEPRLAGGEQTKLFHAKFS